MITRRLKKNKKRGLIKFGFFLYMFIGIFALVWLRTAVIKLEYQITDLQKQKNSVEREKKLISAERAQIYSVKEIENVATNNLRMTPPQRERLFFVERILAPAPYGVPVRSVPNITSSDLSDLPTVGRRQSGDKEIGKP